MFYWNGIFILKLISVYLPPEWFTWSLLSTPLSAIEKTDGFLEVKGYDGWGIAGGEAVN